LASRRIRHAYHALGRRSESDETDGRWHSESRTRSRSEEKTTGTSSGWTRQSNTESSLSAGCISSLFSKSPHADPRWLPLLHRLGLALEQLVRSVPWTCRFCFTLNSEILAHTLNALKRKQFTIDLGSIAGLYDREHELHAYCPRCDRWAVLPLAQMRLRTTSGETAPLRVRAPCANFGEGITVSQGATARQRFRPPTPGAACLGETKEDDSYCFKIQNPHKRYGCLAELKSDRSLRRDQGTGHEGLHRYFLPAIVGPFVVVRLK
jgi:hypothetical protein